MSRGLQPMLLFHFGLSLAAFLSNTFMPFYAPFNSPNSPVIRCAEQESNAHIRANFKRNEHCVFRVAVEYDRSKPLKLDRPAFGGYIRHEHQLILFINKNMNTRKEILNWSNYLHVPFHECEDLLRNRWHLAGSLLYRHKSWNSSYLVEVPQGLEAAWSQAGKDLLDGNLTDDICALEKTAKGLIFRLASGTLNQTAVQVVVGGAIGAKHPLRITAL